MFDDQDEYENPDCGTTDADMADFHKKAKARVERKEREAQEAKKYSCKSCKDTGVLEQGIDIPSTTFCKCPEGEEAFIGHADGEMSSGPYYDPQYEGGY